MHDRRAVHPRPSTRSVARGRTARYPAWVTTLSADEPRRFTDERFSGLTPTDLDLAGAILVGCEFVDCDLSEASLRGAQLADCRFEGCEMPMVDLTDAVLQSVELETCRLTGVTFGAVRRLPIVPEAKLRGCDLSFAGFWKLDLTAWSFEGCRLAEAEFVRCELRGVSFAGADLTRCTFQRCDLTEADLRGARGYVISPLDNGLRGMRVSLPEALGLLAAVGVEVE